MKMRWAVWGLMTLAATGAAALTVNVEGVGKAKKSVEIDVADGEYARTLKRNLELSGCFQVTRGGGIRVSGTPGATVQAVGEGKSVSSSAPVTDAASKRMAARKLADAMCKGFADQEGFACDRVAFMNRVRGGCYELCIGYPDGKDVRQLTNDAKPAIGPRWKNANSIYYVAYLQGSQQIYEIDVATGKRHPMWNIKGLGSPAAVSPDGTKVALVASFQGNPELYVLSGTKLTRLTNTPNAGEGCPCWSPDGRQIVYVSDASRKQQLYVIDVATRQSRRLTTQGRENLDPDWGVNGITYITKRSGAQVAVMDPKAGDKSSRVISKAGGNWEHPTWARDGRHVVASGDKKLFILDADPESTDAPAQMFNAKGQWIDPVWCR